MKWTTTTFLLLSVLAALTPAGASADDGPTPLAREDNDWDHLELSMGFMGGQRRYRGDTETPFDETVAVLGLRYDVRMVVSYVRMSAGVDFPFPSFDAADTLSTEEINGELHQVAIESIRPYELRFGIGGEYPVGAVAPFVDLIGGVHWTRSELLIDGVQATHRATTFALSARAGVRLHVRRWFFASVAGEVGIVGDVRWGAEVAVGFAVL